MYYWDGAAWVTTLSPDGRYRWNGSTWVPVSYIVATPYATPAPTVRQPTSWTRPLQYAVAAWYAISSLVSLSVPFWMSGQMTQIMHAAIQRQQAQNPYATPPPPGFYDAMNSMMTGVLWFAAIFAFALAVLVVAGALMRWTWLYYLVLVFLGLGVVSGPINLLNFFSGGYSSAYGYTPPTWLYAVGVVSWFPSTALFVAMLIALVKRGPWAMVNVPAAGSPAA